MKTSALVVVAAVLLMSVGGLLAQQTVPATPTATLQRIDENRYGKIDPKYMSTGHSTTTNMQFKVTGLPFKPTRVGMSKVTELKDDAGTDLMASTMEVPQSYRDWQNVYNASSDNSINYTIIIGRSPRKATKLLSFKGEFSVLGGGEAKEIKIKGASGMIGKVIENDDFKKIGVTVTVAAPPEHLKAQSLPFDVVGASDAITEMQLLDADGKAQPSSFSRSPLKDKQGEQLFIGGGKIDETFTINIKYVVGQQKVTLPFEYKDLPLP